MHPYLLILTEGLCLQSFEVTQVCGLYLQPGVAGQYGRLVVDRDDDDGDGDRKAAAVQAVGCGRQCEAVLQALRAVVHVVDLARLHLEGSEQKVWTDVRTWQGEMWECVFILKAQNTAKIQQRK